MNDNFDIRKFLTENKLTSIYNTPKVINENADLGLLISAIAGPTAIGAVSVGVNKLMDALNNGKFGEKGKRLANELISLGGSARNATGGFSQETNLDENIDPGLLISAIAGPATIGAVSVGINKLMDALNGGKFGEKGKQLAAELANLGRASRNATGGLSQEENLEEAKKKQKPSAGLTKKEKSAVVKKARAGKDIGKKGKGFAKIAKAAGGGKKGTKIAGAAMWRSLKEEQEESKGFNFSTQPRKVTGAAPDEDNTPFIPEAPDTYILSPRQLEILKKWTPPGPLFITPGAKIANGTLYILISMIPELEGKRGRGGKYNVRDHLKASYGKTKNGTPSFEAMEVLKALNYAILNSPEKSVQLPGRKGSQTANSAQPDLKPAMLDYKAIPGKVVDGGYEIPAAPKKEKVEEINNLNENKIMNDNFDLRAYISSKRMLTENFEPMDTNDEFPYEDLEHLYGHKNDDEDYESLERQGEYGVTPETGKGEELYEIEDDELDDEEIDDSEWYKDEEDDEDLEFGAELDKYELPDEFEWEDKYLEEVEGDDETEEEIDDSEWYKDEEDDEDMEFGSVNLDDLEIPERFGWEDDL